MNRRKKLILGLFIVLLVISGCKDSKLKNYEVLGNEVNKTETGEERLISALTEEELSKEEIEKVLYDILDKNVPSNSKNDEIRVVLYENPFFYKLGCLNTKDGEVEMVAYDKDWEDKPTEFDMKIASKVLEKAQESSDLENVIRLIALEENLDVEDVRESFDRVNRWKE